MSASSGETNQGRHGRRSGTPGAVGTRSCTPGTPLPTFFIDRPVSPGQTSKARSTARAGQPDGYPPFPESSSVHARRKRQEMLQILHDFTLWYNWLRVVLDGFEAAIELLRVRCDTSEESLPPTGLDLMRTAGDLHNDMLNSFQDLKRGGGVAHRSASATDSDVDCFLSNVQSSQPLKQDQAHAINVLQSFTSTLERIPTGAAVLDAAVEIVQSGSRPHTSQKQTAPTSSMQHMMVKLKDMQRDMHSGFGHLKEHIRKNVLKPSTRHSPLSWLITPPALSSKLSSVVSETSDLASEVDDLFDPDDTSRLGSKASSRLGSKASSRLASKQSLLQPSTGSTGRASKLEMTLDHGIAVDSRLKDPKCAALWGVTLEQLVHFRQEVINDLSEYCSAHQTAFVMDDIKHVCISASCQHDHKRYKSIPFDQLEHNVELRHLESDMHLLANLVVKPRTEVTGCSLALAANPHGLKIQVFVTHVWTQAFDELVGTLELALEPEESLWLSTLSLNLHDTRKSAANFSDITKSPFLVALRQAQKQVVVMDSETMLPHRAWCAFEVLNASLYGVNSCFWFATLHRLEDVLIHVEQFDMHFARAHDQTDCIKIMEFFERIDTADNMNRKIQKVFVAYLSLYQRLTQNGAGVPILDERWLKGLGFDNIAKLNNELFDLQHFQAQLALQMYELQTKHGASGEAEQNLQLDVRTTNAGIAIISDLHRRIDSAVKESVFKALEEKSHECEKKDALLKDLLPSDALSSAQDDQKHLDFPDSLETQRRPRTGTA